MKKMIVIVLAAVMLLSVAGCDRKPTQTTEATEEGTAPTTHETTAPIQTDETAPATQGLAEQETTVPSQETTSPTDITEPTEPEVTEPTQTKPTEPPVKPTEPEPTKPAEAHKHSYQSRTVETTCEQKGCTVYTCVCGDSYTADEVKALGHDYATQVVAPTTEAGGYTTYTCKRCGHSYQDDFTDKLPQYCPEEEHRYAMTDWLMPTEENPVGWTKYVCLNCGHAYTEETAYVPPASASGVETELLRYINEYRQEQGVGELTWLSGLSDVAQYRAKQLATNFDHDEDDIREADAHFKYGIYVDATEFGDPPENSYYTNGGSEGIGKLETSKDSSSEHVGRVLATGFRDSSGHWRYIGSASNTYVGVGAYRSNGTWYVCVIVSEYNFG